MQKMTKEEQMQELVDLGKQLIAVQEKRREVKTVWVARSKELNNLSQDIRDIMHGQVDMNRSLGLIKGKGRAV